MLIGLSQKKIIDISKKLINKNKKLNKHRISSLTYFALWGDSPGFARVKYEIYGFQKILNFWFKIFKDIASIAFLNNYEVLKNPKINSKNFKKLMVSRSIINDFDQSNKFLPTRVVLKTKGYEALELNAYKENKAGHRFYEREGFEHLGFHFVKRL